MKIPKHIRQKVQSLLTDLIRFPSTRGKEGSAIRYLHEQLAPLTDACHLVPIDDTIMEDPDYAFPLPGYTYQDAVNLECIIKGTGEGPTVIFNTHLDVVPPSEGQTEAFKPRVEQGVIFGRGACDAKGQAATLYALALLLHERGLRLPADVIFHFVVEEENGGNGTLAMIRREVQADAAIVLEPTELAIIPAVRGAVWFQLRVLGQAGHSGNPKSRISALDKAIQAMEILKAYHDSLLAGSRGIALFDAFQDPMPLTFGQCCAGIWPASVPAEAVVKGVLGFLPNRNRFQVQQGMVEALKANGDAWLRDHFELTFPMLNSDGNMIPLDHPVVRSLRTAVRQNNTEEKVTAMTASCDAWLYNNQAKIPTVVFGPGSLSHAHSKAEQVKLDDVIKGAAILIDFLVEYGGKQWKNY
jgi:acetylornithine deacetylase